MDQQQELRQVANGSTYWLRRTGLCGDLWMVTADGVPITAPIQDRDAALVQFNAVTAH